MDRLDCVSSDTSSSVGASEGGVVVALVGGSVTGGDSGPSPLGTLPSVGAGFGMHVLLLLLSVVSVVEVVELEVLETLELESCEVLPPVSDGAGMGEELVSKYWELDNARSSVVLFSSVVTLEVRSKQREKGDSHCVKSITRILLTDKNLSIVHDLTRDTYVVNL